MKKILSMAMAVIATTGLTISAASLNNLNSQDNSTKQEKVEKKDRKGGKEGKQRKGFGQQQPRFNPFEGLNLTDAQKNSLKEVFKPQGEVKAPKEAECCKADTAACCQGNGSACCWQVSPEKAKEQAKDRLAKIKGILTPEQYQQYLENVAVGQMLQKGQRPDARKGKSGKSGKPAKQRKPDKAEKQQQPQA